MELLQTPALISCAQFYKPTTINLFTLRTIKMETDAGITKEFLQDVLKASVTKFVINKGSNVGDGYTCVLYSVDVWLEGEFEPLAILIKCFPTNPARQQFIDDGGIFGIELHMYDTIIPDLIKFQREQNVTEIRLPFAPFFASHESPIENRTGPTKQLDNYLIMTDLRKKGGFRLRDRFKGLDYDHFKLVMEGQATLHALSWAFKQAKGKSLTQLYPWLSTDGFAKMFDHFLDSFHDTLAKQLAAFADEPHLCEGLRQIKKIASPAESLYWSIPLKDDEKHFNKDNIVKTPGKIMDNEEPWTVLRHGDCWINNLLFRYDPITSQPVEVVFIDLQLSLEGDPFGDIMYTLYSNTQQDMRRKHLKSLLHVYYDTFTQVCERFGVEPLPGWSWEEFNRRFYRAQAFGVSTAIGGLTITLKDSSEQKDLEVVDMTGDGRAGDESMKKLVNEIMGSNIGPVIKERLRGVIEDGLDAGVI